MTQEEAVKMGMEEHPGVAMGYTQEEMDDVCEGCGGWEWCYCLLEEEDGEEDGFEGDGFGGNDRRRDAGGAGPSGGQSMNLGDGYQYQYIEGQG
jgi:hypothetical protein